MTAGNEWFSFAPNQYYECLETGSLSFPAPLLWRAGPGLAPRGSDDPAAILRTGGRAHLAQLGTDTEAKG